MKGQNPNFTALPPCKETAIIIGSGPSINKLPIEILRHLDATVFVINHTEKYVQWADYWFTLDTANLYANSQREISKKFQGKKIIAGPDDYGLPTAKHDCDRNIPKWADYIVERSKLTFRLPSGWGAAELAIRCGAKKVYLFGCEHSTKYVEHHYDCDTLRPVTKRGEELWSLGRDAIRSQKDFYLAHNVKLVIPDQWQGLGNNRSQVCRENIIGWGSFCSETGLPRQPITLVLKESETYQRRHLNWLIHQLNQPVNVLTDNIIDERLDIPLIANLPGWWSKIELFRQDLLLGNLLFMDIDSVPINMQPIQRLAYDSWVNADGGFSLRGFSLRDFVHHQRPATGLFSLSPNVIRQEKLFEEFMYGNYENILETMKEYHNGGDQEWLADKSTHFRWSRRWQDALGAGSILSYKINRLARKDVLPQNTLLVCFHGQPKPWEVDERWIPKL